MKPAKLFIIFCLGLALIGFVAVGLTYFLEKQKAFTAQEAKERALERGLKDQFGNPLVSSDEFRQHLLVNEANYQIIYQEKGDFFLISVNGSPFEEAREKAENHFLSLVQAEPKIACQLQVKVVVPQWANPDFAGQTLPLSFCKNE